ncbi:acyl-CoA thioesterase [Actinomadura harenae]|uniref:Acyl-CoA thioesterase n=1 Tax=Actinomadura harenae TaxID=2483351 RepID=A0A3M2LM64_9ACTN|nr:thioesterase family protein [Actinomadura harenae]RMI37910.1 acyl-CoA thioesterase [Actinomadura harenae]
MDVTSRPTWVIPTTVHFDEFDMNGHLHNARFALHVERATTALLARAGFDTTATHDRDDDLRYAVAAFTIEFDAPVCHPGPLLVELTLRRLGRTSAEWAFACRTAPGAAPSATGTRTIVKIDRTGRPTPWTPRMRDLAPLEAP